jgi:hypothetical protein
MVAHLKYSKMSMQGLPLATEGLGEPEYVFFCKVLRCSTALTVSAKPGPFNSGSIATGVNGMQLAPATDRGDHCRHMKLSLLV